MRARIVLVGLVVLLAIALAGCGDSSNSSGDHSGAGGATQSSAVPAGSDASGSSAADAAKQAYEACLNAAASVPDAASKANVKKECKSRYGAIKDASKSIDQKVAEARANCETAAKKIPSETARESALDSCSKIQ
jgi:hypothetical protein